LRPQAQEPCSVCVGISIFTIGFPFGAGADFERRPSVQAGNRREYPSRVSVQATGEMPLPGGERLMYCSVCGVGGKKIRFDAQVVGFPNRCATVRAVVGQTTAAL
jgi:hypothetical protein